MNTLFELGPFHITNDISIVGLVQLVLVVWGLFKLFRYGAQIVDKVESLWTAFNGLGPQDRSSWFYRLTSMEGKVEQMWKKLGFDTGHIK